MIQDFYGSRNMERRAISYVFEESAKVPKVEEQPYVEPEIMKVIWLYSLRVSVNHSRN